MISRRSKLTDLAGVGDNREGVHEVLKTVVRAATSKRGPGWEGKRRDWEAGNADTDVTVSW